MTSETYTVVELEDGTYGVQIERPDAPPSTFAVWYETRS
jgi:hypothetical protein